MLALLEQLVDRGEERRERLAGAGRRGDERVPPCRDRLPRAQLRRGRVADFGREPLLDDRVKSRESHDDLRIGGTEKPHYRTPQAADGDACDRSITSAPCAAGWRQHRMWNANTAAEVRTKVSEGLNAITTVAMVAFHAGAIAALFFIDAGAIARGRRSSIASPACWASAWAITDC